jgi:hypothetical protein
MPRKFESTDDQSRVRRRQHEFFRDLNLKGCLWFSILTIEEMLAKTFVRRLAKREVY